MSPGKRISFWGVGLLVIGLSMAGCSRQDPGLFDTPEAAVQAAAGLIGQSDDKRIDEVFGPGSADLFRSGDDAGDREDAARVKVMIEERVAFEDWDEDTKIALFGDAEWPFPIPLVRVEGGWRFSTEEGREELLNRRVGRNELLTLTALHEVVDAQREYHDQPRDGKPAAYAQQFLSSDGMHDGLYWPVGEDGILSPLGDLVAESDAAQSSAPRPFHGYFYRILTRQGEDAPGGASNYLDENGLLTGGFAVVAWPAKYGNSGVMTFITNQRGLVYQKDLGADTESAAAAMEVYDPDADWVPTEDMMPPADLD